MASHADDTTITTVDDNGIRWIEYPHHPGVFIALAPEITVGPGGDYEDLRDLRETVQAFTRTDREDTSSG